MAPFRAPRLLVPVSATRRAALHAVADPRAGNRGSARRSARRPAPDNLGRTMGLCVSLTASFWEGEDGRYGNQGRRSGNVVLCWRRRVDRGSARHPCKRDHRRSSRARSRVDTRCSRRMALSPGQHLAGRMGSVLGIHLAAPLSQTLGGLEISPDTLRSRALLDEAPWVARNSTWRQSLR
jgi:hypothetical protein